MYNFAAKLFSSEGMQNRLETGLNAFFSFWHCETNYKTETNTYLYEVLSTLRSGKKCFFFRFWKLLFSVSYSMKVMKCDVIPDIFSTRSSQYTECSVQCLHIISELRSVVLRNVRRNVIIGLFTITNQLRTIYN